MKNAAARKTEYTGLKIGDAVQFNIKLAAFHNRGYYGIVTGISILGGKA
jgi:hypothetical protein